jgi:hypothetical protein
VKFYLGTHQPQWLATAGVPLFVSHRRLKDRKTLPKAIEGWALDSGGFSELSMYGEWRTTPEEYVTAVRRYDEEIGSLEWAAPQDWMCEPFMTAKTGLSVLEHQQRTVANFVQLQDLWGDRVTSPFMPPVQGWEQDDYLRCLDLYTAAGVDLTEYPVVGLGSVCRRQATGEIGAIVSALLAAEPKLLLHGFGVKRRGLEAYGHLLNTADSMAWSFEARRAERLPGCSGHKNCANCLRYALAWREGIVGIKPPPQRSLFDVELAQDAA